MDDAHGYEERGDAGEAARVRVNGDYLLVQHDGEPRHIYRRVPQGRPLHPLVSRRAHDGHLYSLVWVEGEE